MLWQPSPPQSRFFINVLVLRSKNLFALLYNSDHGVIFFIDKQIFCEKTEKFSSPSCLLWMQVLLSFFVCF